jgi:hypothetical protein
MDTTMGSWAGTVLAVRRTTLHTAVAMLWCEAMAVEFDPANLHPSLAYEIAMEAVSYPDLFTLMDIGHEGAAVAGEIDIEINRPPQLAMEYEITATIASVQRKHGARNGPFDDIRVRAQARRPESEDWDFRATAGILVSRPVSA